MYLKFQCNVLFSFYDLFQKGIYIRGHTSLRKNILLGTKRQFKIQSSILYYYFQMSVFMSVVLFICRCVGKTEGSFFTDSLLSERSDVRLVHFKWIQPLVMYIDFCNVSIFFSLRHNNDSFIKSALHVPLLTYLYYIFKQFAY